MNDFLPIAVIVGIFNICFLVKIWKATNDISKIRKLLSNMTEPDFNAEYAGKKDYAGASQVNSPDRSLRDRKYGNQSAAWNHQSQVKLKVAEIEAVISGMPSIAGKVSKLNNFLHREYVSIKRDTIKGNERQAIRTWGEMINAIEPLYESIGQRVPEEYRTL